MLVSAREVSKVRTVTSPSSPPRPVRYKGRLAPRRRRRPGRRATRRPVGGGGAAARSAARCAATPTGAGEPGAPGSRWKLEEAADVGDPEPVDRLVGVADDDEVAAVAGDSAEQADLAGSVSWYSSTKTCGTAVAARRGGPSPRSRHGGSGRRSRWRTRRRGRRGSREEQPRGHELGHRLALAEPHEVARLSRPFSRARASTICTSRANPGSRAPGRASRASATASGVAAGAARATTTSCSGADSSRSGAR